MTKIRQLLGVCIFFTAQFLMHGSFVILALLLIGSIKNLIQAHLEK